MAELKLINGGVAIIDEQDVERCAAYRWKWRATNPTPKRGIYKFVFTSQNAAAFGAPMSLHRFLMGCKEGDGNIVDHLDGDTFNNRRSNLRLVTFAQNRWNTHKKKANTHSKFIGVTWNRGCGKWQAGIKVSGRSIHLGLFNDERSAAEARDAAVRFHHGKFGRVNFPALREA